MLTQDRGLKQYRYLFGTLPEIPFRANSFFCIYLYKKGNENFAVWDIVVKID